MAPALFSSDKFVSRAVLRWLMETNIDTAQFILVSHVRTGRTILQWKIQGRVLDHAVVQEPDRCEILNDESGGEPTFNVPAGKIEARAKEKVSSDV